FYFFFFQAEDGIRDFHVTGIQTCALPIYQRNYHVKDIHTSGSAEKLTHINYAFGNVANGKCQIGDAYADYDKFYDAASSVDGERSEERRVGKERRCRGGRDR